MNRCMVLIAVVVIGSFVVIGCSGSDRSPVTPTADQKLTAEINPTRQTQTHLWGYYDLIFDVESKCVVVVPNRSMMFAVNVEFYS